MIRKLFLLFAVSTCTASFSQSLVNNVLSRHHLGFFEQNENAFQLGMGGVRYAVLDSAYSNQANVASTPFLSKGQPVFGLDFSGRLAFQSLNGSTANNRVAYLRGINFAIPIGTKIGIGFGYRPEFSKGYSFNEYQIVDGDSLNRKYFGEGGIQRVFFSLAYAPVKTEKAYFALGFEGSYNFGDARDIRATEYVDFSISNGANIFNDRIRGFSFKSSLALKYDLDGKNSFSTGASYTLQSSWNTLYSDRLVQYSGNYGVSQQITQVLFENELSGTFAIPSILGVGLGWEFHPNGKNLENNKISRIRVYGDFEQIDWSQYKRNLGIADTSFTYSASSNIRFGFEFTPNLSVNASSKGLKYLSKVSYRLGLNLNEIAQPQGNLSDFGITFGFGFPVHIEGTKSSLNFGIRAGRMGENGVNSIQENYIAYQIGIIITPARWERWFRKYKYD